MELIRETKPNSELTSNSKIIVDTLHSFNKKHLKLEPSIDKNTSKFFNEMYTNIIRAKSDFKSMKNKRFRVMEIVSSSSVPKPSSVHPHFFPKEIMDSIDVNSTHHLSYDFRLGERTIDIKLIVTEKNDFMGLDKYNEYIEKIYIITHILHHYSSIECGKHLEIFIYLTDFEKMVPNSPLEEIHPVHVNSAYSDVCVTNSEIVIFRKEEWTKVLIHELFHNYGLDFSKINYDNLKKNIKDIFPINTDCQLAESYAEFFAEIINVALTTFYLNDTPEPTAYLKNAHYLLFYERLFSLFQSVKILNTIGLSYENLYKRDEASESLRNNIYYKENTNVFCYFVVKSILLYNCDEFLSVCYNNNLNVLDFRKNERNLNSFQEFIQKFYQERKFIQIFNKIETNMRSVQNKFMMNTARISGIELSS